MPVVAHGTKNYGARGYSTGEDMAVRFMQGVYYGTDE